jgi:protoporphyrinogen oxidase
MSRKILILGAGPAGLGAAWRLNELGHTDWQLLEANAQAGGLSASFVDARGFTWDIGGHVVFSHYPYFDKVLDTLLKPAEWTFHERASWIRMRDGFLPYPFQHNLWRLPEEERADCLSGLLAARPDAAPRNFAAWLLARFGEGMCRAFLFPYNEKVWAWPPASLGCRWVGERVAEVDVERVVRNTTLQRDDPDWGPNRTLRYPARGGTGEIWRRAAGRLPAERVHFGDAVCAIDADARRARTQGGAEYSYDALISTVPLPALRAMTGLPGGEGDLLATTTHAVGIGLLGAPPPELPRANWIYFPEPDCPFYRVTLMSNYSPHNVPDAARHWSLLCEVSESSVKPVDAARVVDETIQGLVKTGMIRSSADVISTWHHRAAIGYPLPSVERDAALGRLMPALEARDIYSRGRLGAWKYEIGNQDHSFMQGVEVVDRLLLGQSEPTLEGTR